MFINISSKVPMIFVTMIRSSVLLFVIVELFLGFNAVPPPLPLGSNTFMHVSDDNNATSHGRIQRSYFKSKYVDHGGHIYDHDIGGYRIRVDATHAVSAYAHTLAATIEMKMTVHMAPTIFNTLASSATVGVFTAAETAIVYPEMAPFANPAGCGISCAGNCSKSCTADGRKYASLAGAGGRRCVILDDNILCNSRDPYRGTSNILVHEFAHTIKLYGVSSSVKSRITAAFNNARSHAIWTDRYAMSTEEEYWAVGSAVFFNSEHINASGYANDMNECAGHLCPSENAARWNIYNKDIELHSLLVDVYLNGNSALGGNLGTCVK